jgi:hypothetical protein
MDLSQLQHLGTDTIVRDGGALAILGLATNWARKRRPAVSLKLKIGRLRIVWDSPPKQPRNRPTGPGAGALP